VLISTNGDEKCARMVGIMNCGHIWTCPTCSLAIRAERAQRIALAMEQGRGEWRMLTLTIRHHKGQPLAELLEGMMKAWRRTRQGRAFQDVWSDYVSASVRAIEVTWGRKNGWHPHLHVLLRCRKWSAEHELLLFERWDRFVREFLGDACAPSTEHGIAWSNPHDGAIARYVTKMGMELTGYAKDTRDQGSVTPWALAKLAARLYQRDGPVMDERERRQAKEALALWVEFQGATRGRRCIELDDRAQAMAMTRPEDKAVRGVEYTCEAKAEPPPVVVELTAEQVRALWAGERVSPGFTWYLLRGLEVARDPKAMLSRFLASATERYFWKRKAWGEEFELGPVESRLLNEASTSPADYDGRLMELDRAREASASALLREVVERDGAEEQLHARNVVEQVGEPAEETSAA